MSKDNVQGQCPSIFSPQMGANVFIILQIFFAMCAIFKIGEYSQIFPNFSWGILGHVTCLDQSYASEKIWWIIIMNSKIYILDKWYKHRYRDQHFPFPEAHAGGVYGMVCKQKKARIMDHRYKNFVFPNHKNKQDAHLKKRVIQGWSLVCECRRISGCHWFHRK